MAALSSGNVWSNVSQVSGLGGDSDAGDYPVYMRELIASPSSIYEVLELLGRGTFGQVLKCWKKETNEVVALKILKNVPSYTKQGRVEVDVLSRLKKQRSEEFNIVRTHESFTHRGHICIVFEMLHMNLYDYLKLNGFHPLPLKHIRPIAQQVLCCLVKLRELGLVHADLKPENIMLVDQGRQPFRVKVIDFGSATTRTQCNTTTYIQSRYYRAPEVIMGLPYTENIDMWSLACVLSELYLGWPLFPGSNEYDQINYICQMLGPPPDHLFRNVAKARRFFSRDNYTGQWTLKSQTQFQSETGIVSKETRKFIFTSVSAIVQSGNHSNGHMTEEAVINQLDCVQFVSLLSTLLTLDPSERAAPLDCMQHPFITMHHLAFYTNCISVRELIHCMQVCCHSRSTLSLPPPSHIPPYTLPHPTLTYLPLTHNLRMGCLPWPDTTSNVDVGYVSADPSPSIAISTDPSMSLMEVPLLGKINHVFQPPAHTTVPQTFPYDYYWMLPQYWLTNTQ